MANSVPKITVTCVTVTCKQQNKDVEADSGVLLAEGAVLACFASYNCTECGSQMIMIH